MTENAVATTSPAAPKAEAAQARPHDPHQMVAAATEAFARLSSIARLFRPRAPKLRLLPSVIFVSVLMLGVRTGDLVRGLDEGGFVAVGATTRAQDGQPDPSPRIPAPEASPQTPVDLAMTSPEAEVEADAEAEASTDAAPFELGDELSRSERELLRDLSQRRQSLDERAETLDEREALLTVAEQRLQEKMTELEAVRGQIQEMLGALDEQQENQFQSLVGIYENMRPADAAVIFNGLDIDVLINVLDRMREQKSAAIMAGMNPDRARQVTAELAQRQTLPVLGE